MRRPTLIAAHARRAFTIVELLAVVSIIAILLSIVLPSLGGARQAGWAASSQSMQKQLITGLLQYGSSNSEWIPGVNTSGWQISSMNRDVVAARALASQRSTMPVQSYDWMSPAIGDEAGVPLDREARFYYIFENFSDPAQRDRVPVWIENGGAGAAGNPEMAQHVLDNESQPPRAASFLMPVAFQLFGGENLVDRGPTTQLVGVGQARYSGTFNQLLSPAEYAPQTTRVGQLSSKIALADGFRYYGIEGGQVVFDMDMSFNGGNSSTGTWGSFTAGSATYLFDRSWGAIGGGNPGGGAAVNGSHLPLNYRHNGRMDAAFWDGHVEFLTLDQARNPVYWAPTGSTFVAGANTDPKSLGFGIEPGKPIP